MSTCRCGHVLSAIRNYAAACASDKTEVVVPTYPSRYTEMLSHPHVPCLVWLRVSRLGLRGRLDCFDGRFDTQDPSTFQCRVCQSPALPRRGPLRRARASLQHTRKRDTVSSGVGGQPGPDLTTSVPEGSAQPFAVTTPVIWEWRWLCCATLRSSSMGPLPTRLGFAYSSLRGWWRRLGRAGGWPG